jgi:hypothetical protein
MFLCYLGGAALALGVWLFIERQVSLRRFMRGRRGLLDE